MPTRRGTWREWADADADRIGDNLDADVDADGVADDRNNNGKPDNEEDDWDGDGVKNASVIPWDAFPRDPKEWRDSDGDGYSDEEEKQAGTDPLDPARFPEQKAKRSESRRERGSSAWRRSPDRAETPDRRSPILETFGQWTWQGQETLPHRRGWTSELVRGYPATQPPTSWGVPWQRFFYKSPQIRADAHTPTVVASDWGTPVRLGDPINTPRPEDAIEISPDGKRLYFLRTTDVLEKLSPKEILSRPNGTYVAERVGGAGEFAAPRFYDLEKGIDLSLSGETSHTADGAMVYFHSVRPTNTGYQQKPPTNDILDIYAAKVVNGEPQAGVNLGAPVNSVYLDGEQFITPDGKTLYFTSSRPGGLGGNDIYVSHKTEQGWSEPKNLGAPVNSPRGESQSAFAFNDLKTMYFTSDRDPKIGVAIYRSTQQKDGSWSEPELVIKGIVGEPTLTADGSLLYFGHVLTDAKGVFDADVYYVQRKPLPPTSPASGRR